MLLSFRIMIVASCPARSASTIAFQLDRYTFIKELVLLVAGTAALLLCLAGAKRLNIFLVDALLAGYLGLSLVSALAASNGWLAARALGAHRVDLQVAPGRRWGCRSFSRGRRSSGPRGPWAGPVEPDRCWPPWPPRWWWAR